MIPLAVGILAGVLKHLGEANRAEQLIQKLMSDEPYGAPTGLCAYHFLNGEMGQCADCIEKLIGQRHLNAGQLRWPVLVQLMNLPPRILRGQLLPAMIVSYIASMSLGGTSSCAFFTRCMLSNGHVDTHKPQPMHRSRLTPATSS